jgi:hypothetical protein
MSTLTKGNPEGSPSDPLTTDPKGEACHAPESPEIHVTRNTPALIERQGAYGVAVPLDPWYVTGLADGEGCFCISLAIRAKLRCGLEVRPSFSLSLNEKDLPLLRDLQTFFACGWIRESRSDRTFKYEGGRSWISHVGSCRTSNVTPCGETRREAVQASRLSAR